MFVTRTFSDQFNVIQPCSSPNDSDYEIKRLGEKSYSSPKNIFLVMVNNIPI